MYLWLKHLTLIDVGVKSDATLEPIAPNFRLGMLRLELILNQIYKKLLGVLFRTCQPSALYNLKSLTLTCEKKDWYDPGAENCRVDLSH